VTGGQLRQLDQDVAGGRRVDEGDARAAAMCSTRLIFIASSA